NCLAGQSAILRILNGTNGATIYAIADNSGSVQPPSPGTTAPTCNNNLTSCTLDLAANGLSTQTIKIQFEAYGGGGSGADAILTSSTFTAISTISWQGSQGG